MTTELSLTTTTRADGTRVLVAAGEIDLSNNDAFGAAVAEGIAEAGSLVVDLTAVQYLDSSALHSLFTHADGITVVAGPMLMPVLTVSGLTQLTTVEEVSSQPGQTPV
ncbi:STAS domain-containing protein [Actinosynnema sp. NPDC059335]|uniref:STAS domain-containing protein n=1 Tax=Actinosynnema sp. NPDC059335 TaxID=3346804 RepID=UPI003673066C